MKLILPILIFGLSIFAFAETTQKSERRVAQATSCAVSPKDMEDRAIALRSQYMAIKKSDPEDLKAIAAFLGIEYPPSPEEAATFVQTQLANAASTFDVILLMRLEAAFGRYLMGKAKAK